jgi:hypothetical protein
MWFNLPLTRRHRPFKTKICRLRLIAQADVVIPESTTVKMRRILVQAGSKLN